VKGGGVDFFSFWVGCEPSCLPAAQIQHKHAHARARPCLLPGPAPNSCLSARIQHKPSRHAAPRRRRPGPQLARSPIGCTSTPAAAASVPAACSLTWAPAWAGAAQRGCGDLPPPFTFYGLSSTSAHCTHTTAHLRWPDQSGACTPPQDVVELPPRCPNPAQARPCPRTPVPAPWPGPQQLPQCPNPAQALPPRRAAPPQHRSPIGPVPNWLPKCPNATMHFRRPRRAAAGRGGEVFMVFLPPPPIAHI
jgi:hypothetical protein